MRHSGYDIRFKISVLSILHDPSTLWYHNSIRLRYQGHTRNPKPLTSNPKPYSSSHSKMYGSIAFKELKDL